VKYIPECLAEPKILLTHTHTHTHTHTSAGASHARNINEISLHSNSLETSNHKYLIIFFSHIFTCMVNIYRTSVDTFTCLVKASLRSRASVHLLGESCLNSHSVFHLFSEIVPDASLPFSPVMRMYVVSKFIEIRQN
jgi:hypothetical protein